MRDLALRLLAVSQTVSGAHVHEAVLVSDKLRISLTRFAGVDGFVSLQRRALVLARAEVPSLQSVKVGADGRLEGFEQQKSGECRVASGEQDEDEHGTSPSPLATHHSPLTTPTEGAAAVTAHLLGLLVTFIGEPLTLALVREAWPDISLDESLSTTEID
jgi:hypothetical protein